MTDQPNAADMAAFSASDYACYRWPGEEDQALRAAFCEGAAHAVSHIELTQTEVDLIAACASDPAPRLPTIPIEWARPTGNTFEEMRANVWKSGLAAKGDTILIWVNEGDFLHACMTCGSKEYPAVSSIAAPRAPDIESLCHDYAARWFGEDWNLFDEDEKAALRIEAHRWLKCWSAVSSTDDKPTASYCALCDLEHPLDEDEQGFHHVIKGERVQCSAFTQADGGGK